MLNTQFAPWPSFSEEEAEKVKELLLSNKVNYWTGQECREFEKEFAAWTGTRHAIALHNGTLALEVSLRALGVGVGDEVIVTPRTFIASISSVVAVGATPVFADVDADSQNIEADTIGPVITDKTKAVIVVHLAGRPADMDPIMELAELHGFFVVEDCAQAHGARYKGKPVGSIGHVGAWSFCQDKIMTTGGEGGMVTTNDEALWRFMWSYKDHGKSYEAVYERDHKPGFRWLHESFGTNWRMLEMQAAIGRIQLRKMAEWTRVRAANSARIEAVCEKFDLIRQVELPATMEHGFYKHYCFVRPQLLAPGWSRDRIVDEILAAGVPCYQGSCSEVYLEKAFDGMPFKPERSLPVARELGETSLMFLIHPTLTQQDLDVTCAVIEDILAQAQRMQCAVNE
jgi:dTDP-4-amino-4,6-dideoxygalactose transaminase